jgi:hypothetical protein
MAGKTQRRTVIKINSAVDAIPAAGLPLRRANSTPTLCKVVSHRVPGLLLISFPLGLVFDIIIRQGRLGHGLDFAVNRDSKALRRPYQYVDDRPSASEIYRQNI